MKICMKFGDTNFIGLVNAEKYKSFVHEDWELEMLLQHFSKEMMNRNILVFQMTEEGIEHSWNIEINIGTEIIEEPCYRRAVGYIEVTDNKLYLIDYDCLTMSAQFESNKVPDKNCSNNEIGLKNGIYRMDFVQFYNVDRDEYVGRNETDILINLNEASDFERIANKVFWCSYD